MAKLLIIFIAVIGTISAYVRKYDYSHQNNLLHLISHPKTIEKLDHGHLTQRFRSSFGGESVHGLVGLNSFPPKEVIKSKYGVGDGHEYSKSKLT